jgi:hypothetical protein
MLSGYCGVSEGCLVASDLCELYLLASNFCEGCIVVSDSCERCLVVSNVLWPGMCCSERFKRCPGERCRDVWR